MPIPAIQALGKELRIGKRGNRASISFNAEDARKKRGGRRGDFLSPAKLHICLPQAAGASQADAQPLGHRRYSPRSVFFPCVLCAFPLRSLRFSLAFSALFPCVLCVKAFNPMVVHTSTVILAHPLPESQMLFQSLWPKSRDQATIGRCRIVARVFNLSEEIP
jgi:hypothetical protein